MSINSCCLTGFQWNGTPKGITTNLGPKNQATYQTGTNPDHAILIIHDLYGYTFPNIRLLADTYATRTNSTVYIPDFFDGEILSSSLIDAERWADLDIPSFMSRNGRAVRETEILEFARFLRGESMMHKKIAVVGFCYGGWAAFRLGAKEHTNKETGEKLVGCISVGHPSLLTKKDIEEIDVPVQILAPEFDHVFTPELKTWFFERLLARGDVPFEYLHFPGVGHGCFVRGDGEKDGEREALRKGVESVVCWVRGVFGEGGDVACLME